ncbi:CoA transferase [uncultured Paracoccus sp.]|uniref:CoA transferase n=1 Tax=uncultured Paracoccus sp. TaxID=189685 RepID=UPI002622169D|nr:CoA transferase [uncultured Paracoccus sp.]
MAADPRPGGPAAPARAQGPLAGMRAVSLAANVPGPAAAALLAADGMSVVKIEGPAGDLLTGAAPGWYAELNDGVEVRALDLRGAEGFAALRALLADADLLITSQRRGALTRLGLTADSLAVINPDLCWVEIVGDVHAPDIPGHDLTYQFEAGLLEPPAMPRTLLADLAGAGDAARAALALLLGRALGRPDRHRAVGLRQAAESLDAPVRFGLTVGDGFLSGALPQYRIYRAADGWAAVAALEPHFASRFAAVTGDDPTGFLAALPCARIMELAAAHDLPIQAIPDA